MLKDLEYVKGLAQVLLQSWELAAQSQLRHMLPLSVSFPLVTLVQTRCFCLICGVVAFQMSFYFTWR